MRNVGEAGDLLPDLGNEADSCWGEFGYPTVEAALRAADIILAEDAELIWIEDREGNLILPADQVRLRLSSSRSAG